MSLSLRVLAQDENVALGARSSALVGASSTLVDVWSVFNNVGTVGSLEHHSIGISYRHRYPFIELSTIGFSYVHRLPRFNMGVGFYRYGDPLFNRQRVALAIGNTIDFVSMGLGANVIQYHFEGIGSRRIIALELGGVIDILPKLLISAQIFNVNLAKVNSDWIIPVTMKMGACYKPHQSLSMITELQETLGIRRRIIAGIEYQILDWTSIRTGISPIQRTYTFGFGVQKFQLTVDYAFVGHNHIGNSHEFSLSYVLP